MADLSVILSSEEVFEITLNSVEPIYEVQVGAVVDIAEVTVIEPALLSSTLIDDSTPSYNKTYSSQKVQDVIEAGLLETDPVFIASQAVNITAGHITVLNNTSGTNTGDQSIDTITDVVLTDPAIGDTLQFTGTNWVNGKSLQKLPIFSTSSATLRPMSHLEDALSPFANIVKSTGYAAVFDVCYASTIGLYIASMGLSYSTSTDGKTWTERTSLPAVNYSIGSNGTTIFMACANNATTVYASTDGITWSLATALPAASKNGTSRPLYYSGTWVIASSTTGVIYSSTDNGATWTTTSGLTAIQTTGYGLHSYAGGFFYSVYAAGVQSAWVSTDGITWTAKTMPQTQSTSLNCFSFLSDGSVAFTAYKNSAQIKTSDFITFTEITSNGVSIYTSTPAYAIDINGTYLVHSGISELNYIFTVNNNLAYASFKNLKFSALPYGMKWVNGICFIGTKTPSASSTDTMLISINPSDIATTSLNAYYGEV